MEQQTLEQFLLSDEALTVDGVWVSVRNDNVFAPGSESGAIASGYPMNCLNADEALWFSCHAYQPASRSLRDEFATILLSYGAIKSGSEEWPAKVQIEFTEGLPIIFSPETFLNQYYNWLFKIPVNVNATLLKAWTEELEFQRETARKEAVEIFLEEVLPIYVSTFFDLD